MIWTLLSMVVLWVADFFIGLLPVGEAFPTVITDFLRGGVGFLWSFDAIVDVSLALHLASLAISLLLIELIISFVRFLMSPSRSGSGPA